MSPPPGHYVHNTTHVAATPQGRRNRPVSVWLWIALMAAMLAIAAAWVAQQRNDVAAPPVGERVLPAPGDSRTVAPEVRPAATASEPQARRAPALAQDRDARPLSSNAMPDYPREALRSRLEGSVVARLQVGADGRVQDVSIVSREGARDRALDRAVIDATRSWRFEPAMRDGQAVASVVQVPVDFSPGR